MCDRTYNVFHSRWQCLLSILREIQLNLRAKQSFVDRKLWNSNGLDSSMLRPWERYNWNPKNGESSPNLVLNWRILASQQVNERSFSLQFHLSQLKRGYLLIDPSLHFLRYKFVVWIILTYNVLASFFWIEFVKFIICNVTSISFNPILRLRRWTRNWTLFFLRIFLIAISTLYFVRLK